ncbi:MAG: cupin domain-containing protein [Promethearchaeota archaeon]
MVFKLKEKCLASSKKEVFYGAIINKEIKDAYLGLGFLDPGESRTEGPGKGHEEIIYIIEGQIQITIDNHEIVLNEGEAYHLADGLKAIVTNKTTKRSFFAMAGGHTKVHSHHTH